MVFCYAEAQSLTLTNAIKIAQENSLDAQIARFSFMSKYWQYRSFKAELLPSVNLSGMLGNFNHSVVEARDPETGRVNQVNNNTMANYLTLSLDRFFCEKCCFMGDVCRTVWIVLGD